MGGCDSIGLAGGLILCWGSSITVKILFVSQNYVCCEIMDEKNVAFYLVCVYGAPMLENRQEVWNTLKAFIWSHPGKHLLLGDFNQVELDHQKLGGNKDFKGGIEFTSWKLDCSIFDLPYHGVQFTWTNNRIGSQAIFEQLDRAYCNDS